MLVDLNPEKALIFRIVHKDNVPWLLDNGLHCPNSHIKNASYISIGSPELTQKRTFRVVPCAPWGNLNDYVPFYFTPCSPMLLNIKTGWGGIRKRSNEEIVIMASSLRRLERDVVRFVFTDRHAYLEAARFSSDLSELNRIDWKKLQERDFKKDTDDPGKLERYQAEALIHRLMPIDALRGLACYTDLTASSVRRMLDDRGLKIKVVVKPGWYF